MLRMSLSACLRPPKHRAERSAVRSAWRRRENWGPSRIKSGTSLFRDMRQRHIDRMIARLILIGLLVLVPLDIVAAQNAGAVVGTATLPRDLTPWGMYQ